MKLLLVLILLSLGACSKNNLKLAPSLVGKTLKGTITSGTDAFSGLEGYQFSTQFLSENQFESKNATGILESIGQYSLHQNRLILQSSGALHPRESLEVILKFTDTKSGVYEAHYLSGPSGEQTGIFTLQ